MVAKQKSVVQVKEVGPTWWLPIDPAGDDLDEAGVPEAEQEQTIYVAVQDAKNWAIDGDGEVYYGYAVKVGGIYHHKGRKVAKPSQTKKMVTVPVSLLVQAIEGNDDLMGMAETITCYCDEFPNAKMEDEHRGAPKAFARLDRLVSASKDEIQEFMAAKERQKEARAGKTRFEVNVDLGCFAVVYADDEDQAIAVAEEAIGGELDGVPLPDLAEEVTIGEYHAHEATATEGS